MEKTSLVPESKVLNSLNLAIRHYDLELVASLLEIFPFKQTKENLEFVGKMLTTNLFKTQIAGSTKAGAAKSIVDTLVSEGWDLEAPLLKESFQTRGYNSAISGNSGQEAREFCIIDLLLATGHLDLTINHLVKSKTNKEVIDFLIKWDVSKGVFSYGDSYTTPSKLCSLAVNSEVEVLDKLLDLGFDPNYRKVTSTLQKEVYPAFCYAKNNEQLSVFVKHGADFSVLKDSEKTFIDVFKRIEDTKERSAMFKTYEEQLKLQAKNKNQTVDFSGEIASIEKFLVNKKIGILEIKRLIKSIGSNLKDFKNSKGESFGYLVCKYERQDLVPSLAKEGIDILNLKGSDGSSAILKLLECSISNLKPAKTESYTKSLGNILPLGLGDSARSFTRIIEESDSVKIGWAHQRILLKWFNDSVSANPDIKDDLLSFSINHELLPITNTVEILKANGGLKIKDSNVLKKIFSNLFINSLTDSYDFYNGSIIKLLDWLKQADKDDEKVNNLFVDVSLVDIVSFYLKQSIAISEKESRYFVGSLGSKKQENIFGKILELKEIVDARVGLNVPTRSVEGLFDNFVEIFSNQKSLFSFDSMLADAKRNIEPATARARVFKILEPYLGTAMLALASIDENIKENSKYPSVYEKTSLLYKLADIVEGTGISGYAPEVLMKARIAPWIKTIERTDLTATLEKAIFDAQIKSNESSGAEEKKVSVRL